MKIAHPELMHAPSLEEAERRQEEVRELVRLEPWTRSPHRVAGCDVAYDHDGVFAYAAAVAVNVETLRTIESPTARSLCTFPYIPGLFAFREAPPLVEALRRLSEPPDLILVDGHGIAHPRGAGLACHLGVVLDVPAAGCAKTPLGGTWTQPPERAGAWSPIEMDGKVVGAAYRHQAHNSPVFVSPGHRVNLDALLTLLPKLFRDGGRSPLPLQLAHQAAVKSRGRLA
jgi:deoxyribonuclease V